MRIVVSLREDKITPKFPQKFGGTFIFNSQLEKDHFSSAMTLLIRR